MAVSKRRGSQFNDLDLSNWQQYDDLLTDSLWILDSRDSSGAHQADYHGNFIPQIPHQLLRRFTKPGDIVLDPFIGSGTTAIEANRLRRRWIGVEISKPVAALSEQRIREDSSNQLNYFHNGTHSPELASKKSGIIVGDSAAPEVSREITQQLAAMGADKAQFIIMHPPYHNIIHFTDNPSDLSNCEDVNHFMERFLAVYNNLADFLDPRRHLAVVIGDIYQASEWIPLQSLLTTKLLSTGDLRLKSVIVKNMINNRAKRNQERLWRYRALANGFYIFKHEYIVLFQKLGRKRKVSWQ